jgi:hypothetical protein
MEDVRDQRFTEKKSHLFFIHPRLDLGGEFRGDYITLLDVELMYRA